jgi:hypothetical protein
MILNEVFCPGPFETPSLNCMGVHTEAFPGSLHWLQQKAKGI